MTKATVELGVALPPLEIYLGRNEYDCLELARPVMHNGITLSPGDNGTVAASQYVRDREFLGFLLELLGVSDVDTRARKAKIRSH